MNTNTIILLLFIICNNIPDWTQTKFANIPGHYGVGYENALRAHPSEYDPYIIGSRCPINLDQKKKVSYK